MKTKKDLKLRDLNEENPPLECKPCPISDQIVKTYILRQDQNTSKTMQAVLDYILNRECPRISVFHVRITIVSVQFDFDSSVFFFLGKLLF